MPVVEARDLVGNAELRAAAPLVVEQAQYVPLVMRAVAERDGGAQPIVVPERRLACAALFDRLA